MPLIRDRVIKGDSRFVVDVIMESHEAYKYYINRWSFLNDSYQGGYDYFMGRYLEPYYYESRDDYEKRLRQIGVDNHVKSVVGIYNSFLFRRLPQRDYGQISEDPSLEAFLKDSDLDGRSFEAFMRDVSTMSMVYGAAWVIVDKPQTAVLTRADELDQEIRPYVSLFTPDNVLDWEYERMPNGTYRLTYLKVKEEIIGKRQYVREYTPEEVNVYMIDGQEKTGGLVSTLPNSLGQVPAVCVYAQRSNIRGIGTSIVGDIADFQKEIYEYGSEIEQIIRITNHPSLVKSVDTEASAGAGSIIQLPQNLDPGLKPYLLQPDGTNIEAVLETIRHKIESVDRMAALGGIRSVQSRTLSGVALQTEFQLLQSRLSDFAMNLELAEEQIWRLWCLYQDTSWDGEVKYPRTFGIQDKANDLQMLKLAKESGITDPVFLNEINERMYEILFDHKLKDEYMELEKDPEEIEEVMRTTGQQPMMDSQTEAEEHPAVTSPQELVAHFRSMVDEGYTDQQILELHPELAVLFGNQR